MNTAKNEHCYKWTLFVEIDCNATIQMNELCTCATNVIELQQESNMLTTTNMDVLQMNSDLRQKNIDLLQRNTATNEH